MVVLSGAGAGAQVLLAVQELVSQWMFRDEILISLLILFIWGSLSGPASVVAHLW